MFVHDLDVLLRDRNQSNLYDLTARTFVPYQVRFFEHKVQADEEMRIDLICHRIYRTTEYTDILLTVNQILNPLNIRTGDVLRYPEAGTLDFFRVVPPQPPSQKPSFVNQGRVNIKDPRRLQFIENNFQLPPTLLPEPQSPIVINPDNITIVPLI